VSIAMVVFSPWSAFKAHCWASRFERYEAG
jgi:hypothetical protein